MQDRGPPGQGGDRVDNRGEGLVGDLDQVERVLRDVAVAGHDHGHGFADIADAVGRDRPGFQRRLDADHHGGGERLDVIAGEDGCDARHRARPFGVDRGDLGMCVRRAQDRSFERSRAGAQVVKIATTAGQERGVFDALNRTADPALNRKLHEPRDPPPAL